MPSERETLLGKALQAFKWNAAGIVLRIVLQFGTMVVLARLIGPEGFGFFGGSLLVFGLSILVAERGLGVALVQRAELVPETRQIAWGKLLVSHIAVAGLLLLGAPVLASLVGDPALTDGIRALAVAVPITALSVIPLAELRRRLDFRRIQQAQLGGYCAGFILAGIPLAATGWGGWSLVAAVLVQQTVIAGIAISAAGLPGLPRLGQLPAGMPTFGLRVVGSNLANWATENLDNLFIGHFKGLTALGTYSVAYNLARTPTNHVVNLIQQVVFATSARVQDDAAVLARGYLALLRAIALVTLPVFCGAAVVADSVVGGLYGERWAGAGEVFAALCVAMPCHALMAAAGPILWGRGRTGVELRVQLGVAALLLAVLILLMDGSLATLAWGVCAVYAARAIWLTGALARELAIAPGRLARALATPTLLAAGSTALLGAIDILLATAPLSPEWKLAALVGGAATGLLVVAALIPSRLLGSELAFLEARIPFLRRRAACGAKA